MEEIDENEYSQLLQSLADKKWATLKGTAYVKRNKTAEYLIRRGFESGLVWQVLKEMG
jgi:regulatory protein